MNIFKRIAFWWYSDPDHRGSVIVGIWFTAFSSIFGFVAYTGGWGYFSILIGIFALPLLLLSILVAAIPLATLLWLGMMLVDYIGKLNRRLREWSVSDL